MTADEQPPPGALDEAFDYVIVGSGAAGAVAARVLADTGARLAVVEEGPAVPASEFGDAVLPSLQRLYRDQGLQVARGRTLIPVLQGRCLGGTTVINSGICWRLPDDVWAPWSSQYGLGAALPLEALHAHWDQLERELRVQTTPRSIWGRQNELMDAARERLQVAGHPMRRYVDGCRGSGRCSTGCPHGAKQSMLVSYLPYAAARGAVLLSGARVERVLFEGRRAVAVSGQRRASQPGAPPPPFVLRARRGVLVAASAIQTPGLLRRSGVRSAHLGRHFQGHPGTALVGVFDQPVAMWSGATQGYEIDALRVSGRVKLETLSLPPDALLGRLPGVGGEWAANMAQAPYMALWAVLLRSYAHGSVSEGRLGTNIRFDLTPEDMLNLRRGLRFTAEALFAAGAREVLTGIYGLPDRLRGPDEARLLETGPADPACYAFTLSHLFGTARMSVRPQDGVVGPDFRVHGTEGLYVLDSSLFPTNLGVNPQHTIMAVAMHGAKKLAGLA